MKVKYKLMDAASNKNWNKNCLFQKGFAVMSRFITLRVFVKYLYQIIFLLYYITLYMYTAELK